MQPLIAFAHGGAKHATGGRCTERADARCCGNGRGGLQGLAY